MVRAGQDRQDIIAELTGLHPELITLIMAQGVSNGWLDSTASELTVKGSRLLDDEEDDLVNLKAGFLLQDAVTGNYWPRMVTKLEQIEPIDPQAQFPEFASERKTGWKLKPFLVKRTKKELPVLSSELLNRAYRDYRKDYRANQKIGGQIQETQRVRLQGVQRLDASPEAAQIILWITKAEHGDEPLAIQDPFELRKNAWWLLKDFKQKLGEDHNLRRYMADLIDIPDVASLSNEEWLKAIENKAEFDLLIEHSWVERQPDIRRYFSTLLKWREKIEQGSNDDADLEAAIGDCQKLLEVVMQWLIKTYPVDDGQTPSQKHFSRDLNLKLLEALKIPSFTDNSINLLARQPLKQVIGACKNPTSSLKALVFAAAMGVIAKPDHPLMVLTSHELDIDKLIELANLRNESSHGRSSFVNKKQTNLTEEIVLENIDFSLNFTTCFKEWM
ncbi:hypothetical protein GCM10007878_02400 [Marinospirillum insulare]|uniref:Apea-like HEPN domain-containing protein n=1 Tax=Marinospirillum insulare TaxID=217169 RepID=A0ABQ5ZUS9_9GAMM|nr:hypothetical protein GCM10007878_02400 [Marinospirillum insulare]